MSTSKYMLATSRVSWRVRQHTVSGLARHQFLTKGGLQTQSAQTRGKRSVVQFAI